MCTAKKKKKNQLPTQTKLNAIHPFKTQNFLSLPATDTWKTSHSKHMTALLMSRQKWSYWNTLILPVFQKHRGQSNRQKCWDSGQLSHKRTAKSAASLCGAVPRSLWAISLFKTEMFKHTCSTVHAHFHTLRCIWGMFHKEWPARNTSSAEDGCRQKA